MDTKTTCKRICKEKNNHLECFGTWPNHPNIKKGIVQHDKDVSNYLKHLKIRNASSKSV